MNRCRVLIAGLLLALLVSQVPIFVRLTLTPDAVLYDLQAGCLLEGGVLYRDVLEPNLPGVVWIHAVVRSVAGWSPEALQRGLARLQAAVLATRQKPDLAVEIARQALLGIAVEGSRLGSRRR